MSIFANITCSADYINTVFLSLHCVGIKYCETVHFASKLHFNLLKEKLVQVTLKKSNQTSKRTKHLPITTISWLMLCKEVIDVYSENYLELINIFSYHWALRVQVCLEVSFFYISSHFHKNM